MILRFILYALGIYIIYKVVFELIIPIFRTTRKIRQQFGAMQQQMQDQMNAAQNQHGYSNPNKPGSPSSSSGENKSSVKAGDYIDFEEVE